MNILQLQSEMQPDDLAEFRAVVAKCRLNDSRGLSDRAKATVVSPFLWFLNHAAGDGLKLTKAGNLPTRIVDGLLEECGWIRDWKLSGNRELETPLVDDFHYRMHDLELVYQKENVLRLTDLGKTMLKNPASLWDFLIRAVLAQDTQPKRDAVRLLMVFTASNTCNTETEYLRGIAGTLWAAGTQKGNPLLLERPYTFGLIADAYLIMHLLGVYSTTQDNEDWRCPTITGLAFARHALAIQDEELPALYTDISEYRSYHMDGPGAAALRLDRMKAFKPL